MVMLMHWVGSVFSPGFDVSLAYAGQLPCDFELISQQYLYIPLAFVSEYLCTKCLVVLMLSHE